MNDSKFEQEIIAKGLTAPRITANQIEDLCGSLTIKTHHFEGTSSTVALAILPNGFVAGVGHSASVSPENFDAEIGARIATQDALAQARKKLWEMEGYALKKQLS